MKTNLGTTQDGVLRRIIRMVLRRYLEDSRDRLSVRIQHVTDHLRVLGRS